MLTDGQRLDVGAGIVERVGVRTVACNVDTAVRAGDVDSDVGIAQDAGMRISHHHPLHGQRVMIQIGIQTRTSISDNITGNAAATDRTDTLAHCRRIVVCNRRVIHEYLNGAGGQQLAPASLVLTATGGAAVRHVGVLIVERVNQGDAGIAGRRIGVAVGNTLNRTIDQCGRRAAVEAKGQAPLGRGIGIAADRGSAGLQYVTGSQVQRTRCTQFVFGRGTALAGNAERGAVPVVALGGKFLVGEADIRVDHDSGTTRCIGRSRGGVD